MLSSFSLLLAVVSAASAVTARHGPSRLNARSGHQMHKRQGTLVESTDETDFGACSTPEIEFGVGFDGRVEASFRPVDLDSFNHGSAQNIGIITEFICDTLVNTCGALTAAHDLCVATEEAVGAGKEGVLADQFNAAFGITTNFGDGAAADAGAGDPAAAATSEADAADTTAAATDAAATASVVTITQTVCGDAATETGASTTDDADIAGAADDVDLGSCSDPTITFANGLDGRTEPAFIATNQDDFPHGSAQNIGIIASFIIDRLGTACGAGDDALETAADALAAAQAAGVTTGAAADAWNDAFGFTSDFASVA